MFQISKEQITYLQRKRALELVPRFIEELCEQGVVDQSQWNLEDLHVDTVVQIESALRIGLSSGRDVMGFLQLRHLLGTGFENLPEINQELNTPTQPEGWRVFGMMLSFESEYWITARDRVAMYNKP